ncbi:sugar phosphate isomerase/epimerase family protein [Vallitalea guaymasensis]|uniref:sugar phosphate isomerase/epimerase family protein n=1 Tax=Vallitalea guaymasensis TaxID=1185412 RepID=UPI000DE42A86|nr:sugar phosphate isomerase/epimerase family protein [Vallitalea guaymasensis]
MKLGVSSYSFLRLVQEGKMKQIDVIKKAKEMGFDAVEFINFILEDGETDESFAKRAYEESKKVGIDIESYTISSDFINGSNGDLEAEIERVKREVDIANILGAKSMRHDATIGFTDDYRGQRSFEHALPILIRGYREVTEYAMKYGIKTMVENHGFFCQDSSRVEKLVNGVNHPNFGVLIDMGNFVCVDEQPEKALGVLMPYAFHVHAKDFHMKSGMLPDPGRGWFQSRGGNYLRGSIIGHGDVPILQCLRIMKKYNYDGVLSIEFEGLEDPLTGIEVGLENLRKYIEMA